jgi:hypothetical protein
MHDRAAHLAQLTRELTNQVKRANKRGAMSAARLNGTSDVNWARVYPGLMESFPRTVFYEYTKSPHIFADYIAGRMPSNFHLTVSYGETPSARALAKSAITAGVNVAVVFRDSLPARFLGADVINGDRHDLRFLDPAGVVVGLIAKGSRARADLSGFVVDQEEGV